MGIPFGLARDPRSRAKSLGGEDTFAADLAGAEALRPHIHGQALRVGRRQRRAGLKARVVQLKLKHAAMTTLLGRGRSILRRWLGCRKREGGRRRRAPW